MSKYPAQTFKCAQITGFSHKHSTVSRQKVKFKSFDPESESAGIPPTCLRPRCDPLPTKPVEECQASSSSPELEEAQTDTVAGDCQFCSVRKAASLLSGSKPSPSQIRVIQNAENNILVRQCSTLQHRKRQKTPD